MATISNPATYDHCRIGDPRTNGPRPHVAVRSKKAKKVWIDLENSPHVPFFKPIAAELEGRGYSVIFTARDCFQVCELADLMKLRYTCIGRHYGKRTLAKFVGLGTRVLQLAPYILRQRPDIAISHGSRSQFLLASILRIPTVTMFDYEYARWSKFPRRAWAMAPEIIPAKGFKIDSARVLKYPGIKEDVYAPSFRPDAEVARTLGFTARELVVTLRPPASEAHYHNPESEKLLDAVFELIEQTPEVKVVLLPRTPKQEAELRNRWPALFRENKVVVPNGALDGLSLIWLSDLVISGGGTMNREAAALGVPVYSIFRGTTGAVDKYLAATGRMVLLESVADVKSRLKLVRRHNTADPNVSQQGALSAIVDHIARILESECPGQSH
jgi:uncharacterized protein